MATISDILRQAIRDSGLSMRRLSMETDINRRCIARFLKGHQLTSDNLDTLATYFGMKLILARSKITLYHRTSHVKEIMKNGFRDGTGDYMMNGVFTGVWFSADAPLSANEGTSGNDCIVVQAIEKDILFHEVLEEGKPYREFIIPADKANKWPKRLMTAREKKGLLF